MKKIMILALSAITAAAVVAAPTAKKSAGTKKGVAVKTAAADETEEATTGREAKIMIDNQPMLGKSACLGAPSVPGASSIGRAYQKPRAWIVLETKYTTYAKVQEQLTFEWHVLLDAKSASENKGNREGLPRYSYFTTSVTYQNVPNGGHAASVCLHPSYYERYGTPCAVGLVISNAKGEVLAGDCWAEGNEVMSFAHPKAITDAFWNNQKVMGDEKIVRRQGLVDRSKTIWALVNPNDYEYVAQ